MIILRKIELFSDRKSSTAADLSALMSSTESLSENPASSLFWPNDQSFVAGFLLNRRLIAPRWTVLPFILYAFYILMAEQSAKDLTLCNCPKYVYGFCLHSTVLTCSV